MSDFERKFGKYAVRDLSLKLIILYLAGYALYFFNSQIIYYLTLNPYAIVHGQIWRIFSWLLIPPTTSNLFFIAIMLFFYYSIGTSLERVWGVWRYNVFIFTGILLTVAASFVWMGFSYLTAGTTISAVGAQQFFDYYSLAFSTYYINMGIFFAYALTFPDAVVLMFFIIPMKVKWLGLLDVAYLIYEFIGASAATRFAILALKERAEIRSETETAPPAAGAPAREQQTGGPGPRTDGSCTDARSAEGPRSTTRSWSSAIVQSAREAWNTARTTCSPMCT